MLNEAAPAKINLTLHVTGRRPDGYHLLDSLVVFAGAHDLLSAAPSDRLALSLGGPFAAGLAAEDDNLVLRAARALAQACGVRPHAALRLEKNLPVASGIGGGSADAAAALRLLSRLWGVELPAADLRAVAARLGADVPVCLRSEPQLMAGIGEVLAPAPGVPDCGLLLINPGIGLSTASVFRARAGDASPAPAWPPGWRDAAGMTESLRSLRNDLEAPALSLCPELAGVLAALRGLGGCLLARMSGSGATCFGLFATAREAEAAAIAVARPGWWCWGGRLWRPAQAPLYADAART